MAIGLVGVILAHIRRYPTVIAMLVVALAACMLPQALREVPFAPELPLHPLRLDALGAFFVVLALFGAAAALAAGTRLPVTLLTTLLLLLGYAAEPLVLTALAFGLASLVVWRDEGIHLPRNRPQSSIFNLQSSIPIGLAVLCLLAMTFLLRLGGSWRYASPLAGAGLNSWVFGLALATALLGIVSATPRHGLRPSTALLLAPAWLYPLTRLYVLGPWNSGWHAAAVLLSGALAFWAALAAAATRHNGGYALLLRSALASALVPLVLGSSAGLAAGAYGLLSTVLLATVLVGTFDAQPSRAGRTYAADHAIWLLTSAAPLTMPFVATWLALSAAVAGGSAAVTPVVWLAALLVGLRLVLRPAPQVPFVVGLLSLAAGACSPWLLDLLVVPLVEQLQVGLSPFGELTIWPWLGVAMLDSSRAQVATLPSLLVGGLLLVLMAVVYLLARLLLPIAAGEMPATAMRSDSLWTLVQRDVFWLRERPPDG